MCGVSFPPPLHSLYKKYFFKIRNIGRYQIHKQFYFIETCLIFEYTLSISKQTINPKLPTNHTLDGQFKGFVGPGHCYFYDKMRIVKD